LLSDTIFYIQTSDTTLLSPIINQNEEVSSHPEMQLAQNQLAARQKETNLEKAGYLPTITAQYGTQNVDGEDGFYQYQVGVSFPLFFNQQKGKIEAAMVESAIAAQNLRETTIQLNNQYEVARSTYQKWLTSWLYYRDEAIPLAQDQLRGASVSYETGAIDYVSFLQNSHAALATELKGLESLQMYLQSKFYLMYFLKH
jgi:cobalt-zinc-cadmium resistance protein CzcA